MEYRFNVKGDARKKLVLALEEQLHTPISYRGAPTFSYEVGDYTIDREGTVTGPELSLGMQVALLEKGFEPEITETFHLITPRGNLLCQRRYDTAAEAEADGYGIYFSHEGRDVYIKPAPDGKTEHSKWFAVVGAPFENPDPEPDPEPEQEPEPEPEAPQTETDLLTIEYPHRDFTPEKLDNLFNMIEAKAPLLKKALGVEAINFTMDDKKLGFAWFPYTEDAETIQAYSQLIHALCTTAKAKTRVTAHAKEDYPNPRFTMRCWLISLGLVGDEFKLLRKLMTATLPGNGAYSKGAPPEKAAKEGGESHE